jgi:transposase
LVRRRKDVKLRIRGLLRENRLRCATAAAWTKAWLAWLEHEAPLPQSDQWLALDHLAELASLSTRITLVEAKIRAATEGDPIVQKLLAQPGVGLATAATLRAEVGRFDRFDTGKQLARFCGVTPRNASSGARQADAGLINAGNRELRIVLVELAHRLITRIKGRWAELAAGMLRRGKPKNVVVAAVANRYVRWLLHELRRDGATSAPARQKGAAPSAFTAASAAVG